MKCKNCGREYTEQYADAPDVCGKCRNKPIGLTDNEVIYEEAE